MTTVTIPQGLAEMDNLVAVSQTSYKEFLSWQKKIKSLRTFEPTTKDLRELAKAEKDYATGKFVTLKQLRSELASNNSRTR